MIKVIFKCEDCGCEKGSVVTWDRTTEVQCADCGTWECMKDSTEQSKYLNSLREIDNHIRSTPDPVKHIVGTLLNVLPEYEVSDEDIKDFIK